MPTHNPNMPSTLTIVTLLQQTEQTIHTIPELIRHLLMSDNLDYQTSLLLSGPPLVLASFSTPSYMHVIPWSLNG